MNLGFLNPLGLLGGFWNWRRVTPPSYYGNWVFNSKIPIWIDTTDLSKPYQDCPHLNVVINRGAELFKNGKWKVVSRKDNNKDYPTEPILKILNNPNPLQNGSEWLEQYYIYRAVWANVFIRALGTEYLKGEIPSTIWMLPSAFITVNPTGKTYNQSSIEQIVDSYILRWAGNAGSGTGYQQMFSPNEIIWKAVNRSPLIGQSKIYSLRKPISNIIAALQSRNIIISERGAIGILSSATKDSEGGIPLNSKERQKVEQAYQRQYNVDSEGRGHVIVTNAALNWQAMSYPMKDLQIPENIEDDFNVICGAYNLDRDIFPSTKGATFENKNQAEKTTYNNGIIPIADDLANTFNDLWYNGSDKMLILDYSHLPIMKEDEQTMGRGKLFKTQAAHQMFTDGIIDAEGYASIVEEDFTGTGEQLTPPQPPLDANAAINNSTSPKKDELELALERILKNKN